MEAVEQDRKLKYKSLKIRELTFYTHMWGVAEVSGIVFTVLRVYGPILRHSNAPQMPRGGHSSHVRPAIPARSMRTCQSLWDKGGGLTLRMRPYRWGDEDSAIP